jgi:hypothetical protein
MKFCSFGIYFRPDLTVDETNIGNITKLIQGGVYTVLIQFPFDGSNDDPVSMLLLRYYIIGLNNFV